jgi:hypothetical protein
MSNSVSYSTHNYLSLERSFIIFILTCKVKNHKEIKNKQGIIASTPRRDAFIKSNRQLEEVSDGEE